MILRGSAASSPSAAAASKPMKPVNANTIAWKKSWALFAWLGLNGESRTPESPPLPRMMIPSSSRIPTPAAAKTELQPRRDPDVEQRQHGQRGHQDPEALEPAQV